MRAAPARQGPSTGRVVAVSLAILAAVVVAGALGVAVGVLISVRSNADITTVTTDGTVVVDDDELFEVQARTDGTGDAWEVADADGATLVASTVPRDRPGEPEALTFELRPTGPGGSITFRHVGSDGDELERSTVAFVTDPDRP